MLDSASSNLWRIGLAITALKLLMIPAYYSSDFEVHRNWMAITSTLPISHWYVEETSEWTIDYPPLFAWFERLLAYPAALFDPAMLYISKLPYKSPECVLFQRLSVEFTDAVLLSGLWLTTRKRCGSQKKATRYMVAANVGLLIVDHIHFQYNGLLLGILLWSIALIQEGRDVAAAFLFALLLNMKHLFAALAPLYFVYLLRHHCRGPHALYRFTTVGSIVAAVFALSFGPFALMGQMPQLLRRLFPFHRGLLHAYWAPNLWALYAFIDKSMSAVVQVLGISSRSSPASMTGGLVQASHFSILPNIGAGAAAAIVLASMVPLLVSVWRRPDPACFACYAALASLNSFMLGYHVHEKAVLLCIVPLALEAARSLRRARIFQRLSTIGHFSLLPLIYTQDECLLKMLMVLAYLVATCILLEQACTEGVLEGQKRSAPHLEMQIGSAHQLGHSNNENVRRAALLTWADYMGITVATLLQIYCTLLHPYIMPTYPFWPLLQTSLICAVGLLWVWAELWIHMLCC